MADQGDRVYRWARPERDSEYPLSLYALQVQQAHVPEDERAPVVVPNERAELHLEMIQQLQRVTDEIVDAIVPDIGGTAQRPWPRWSMATARKPAAAMVGSWKRQDKRAPGSH